MIGIGFDLRHAARALARSPGFTIVAVCTLALGIGATTAVYSIVRGLLWRPLPFPSADRIVTVHGANPIQGIRDAELSLADLRDLRAQTAAFSAFASFYSRAAAVTGPDGAERVDAFVADPALFDILGVPVMLGRTFREDEARSGAAPVAVLGHGLWQRRFGADSGVVGRTIPVDGVSATVIGVMPPRFQFERADVWLPLVMDPAAPRDERYALGIGRLAPGATVAGASEALVVAAARLERDFPGTNRGWGVEVARYRDDQVDAGTRLALALMAGSVVVVLLIACANVAGLLLARATARGRELAVRRALGAGRWRITWHLLLESAMLAVLGSALGVVLAAWWNDVLIATLPAEDVPPWFEYATDGRALAVTVGIGVVAVLLFGLLPALRASRPDLVAELKGGGLGVGGRTGWLRHVLVVAQVALSVVLLAAATLFTQSFLAARRGDLGFEDGGIVAARVYFGAEPARGARVAWMREAVARARQVPGVVDAALTGAIPGDDGGDHRGIAVEGATAAPGEEPVVTAVPTSAGYFATLQLAPLAGRTLTDAEAEDSVAAVAVVGRTLAARVWPGSDAVGRRIRLLPDTAWLTVVGVVPDLQYEELGEDVLADRMQVHVPYARAPWRSVAVLARTTGSPAALADPLRRALMSVRADVPVFAVRTMGEVRSETSAGQRLYVLVFGGFGIQALVMAAVGLYGLLAYGVAQRRREIGVRMALGASRGIVVRSLVAQAAGLTAIGLVGGLGGALLVSRLLASVLWGLHGTLQPLGLVGAVLMGAAVVASAVPAFRASRVPPMVALRAD